MRKEIIDFLEDAKKTPKELPHIDYDRHLSVMMEIYRRIDIDRPNVLAQDCFMLLSTYRLCMIGYKSGNDSMRYEIAAIERMVTLLIAATDQYTQLSDSALKELGLYPFMDGTFGDYMKEWNRAKEIHEQEMTQAQNKTTNGMNSEGVGSNATTKPETPPATKELPEELNTDKLRGILERGIGAEIIEDKGNNCYSWKKSLELLAYFAIRVTKVLGIKKSKYDAAASWKPFEVLFNISPGTLRSKKPDWEKRSDNVGKPFRPIGWEDVEALLNENVK